MGLFRAVTKPPHSQTDYLLNARFFGLGGHDRFLLCSLRFVLVLRSALALVSPVLGSSFRITSCLDNAQISLAHRTSDGKQARHEADRPETEDGTGKEALARISKLLNF